MNFLPEPLELYIDSHTTPEPEVLQELSRETWARIHMPQMISGHVQGQFLRMISQLVQPKKILEIGTFTGYSAICLSAGLQSDGTLFTIDINEELAEMVRRYLQKAGIADRVQQLIGNAKNIIPAIDATFDLVFIDADKENYTTYYDLVINKVRSGGIMIADNALWNGKVLEPNPDAETKGIMAFNDKVQHDDRVENVLIPIRDGMMMIRKK